MIIDCESCTMKDLACSDCVVSVFLSIATSGPAKEEVSPQEITALSALADVGLVPPLRFAQ
ncbi:MAG: hypothetical protein WCP64_00235 [Actinomycetes bacterium]